MKDAKIVFCITIIPNNCKHIGKKLFIEIKEKFYFLCNEFVDLSGYIKID